MPLGGGAPTETDRLILENLDRLNAADAKAEIQVGHGPPSPDIRAAVTVPMKRHKTMQTEAFELSREAGQDQTAFRMRSRWTWSTPASSPPPTHRRGQAVTN